MFTATWHAVTFPHSKVFPL